MTCIDCMSRDNHAMACNEDTCHINDKAQWVPKPGMQMQLSVHHSASVHGHFYGIGLGPYRKIRNHLCRWERPFTPCRRCSGPTLTCGQGELWLSADGAMSLLRNVGHVEPMHLGSAPIVPRSLRTRWSRMKLRKKKQKMVPHHFRHVSFASLQRAEVEPMDDKGRTKTLTGALKAGALWKKTLEDTVEPNISAMGDFVKDTVSDWAAHIRCTSRTFKGAKLPNHNLRKLISETQ